MRVVLGSTRYLTTRVKKRLCKHRGKGALCTQRSQVRRTRVKGFLGREGDTLNKEPWSFSTERQWGLNLFIDVLLSFGSKQINDTIKYYFHILCQWTNEIWLTKLLQWTVSTHKNCVWCSSCFVFLSVFRLGSVCSKSAVSHCRHGKNASGTRKGCQVKPQLFRYMFATKKKSIEHHWFVPACLA